MRLLISTLLCLMALSGICAENPKKIRKDGITVYGKVCCEGKPVSGVLISDGVLFTKTDSLGEYELPSQKFQGAVFMITPSGYEPLKGAKTMAQFWAPLNSSKPREAEQRDFFLRKTDNSRHRIIFSSNLQLCTRNDDVLQLRRFLIPALQNQTKEAKNENEAIYSIMLGDMSDCSSWYGQDVDITDIPSILKSSRWPMMNYCIMGEQDYDGAIPAGGFTDYEAERAYCSSLGPKYYSVNIGLVHYVMLDTTFFRNDPGDGNYPTDIAGKRNYDTYISSDQLSWLRKDLSYIEDKDKPLVLCMHHPALRATPKGSLIKAFSKTEYTDSLLACLKGFSNVHIFSAHGNRRRVSKAKTLPHITEHSVPSAGGNTWNTAFDGFEHFGPDGMYPGVEILRADSCNLTWKPVSEQYYDIPFRVYDMNEVRKSYQEDPEVAQFFNRFKTRIDYSAQDFENYIYINYWGDEPGAKLEVWEGTKRLKPKSVQQDDPMSTRFFSIERFKRIKRNNPNFGRNTCQHLFRVKSEGLDSVITVRTKNPFGTVHELKFKRPYPFGKGILGLKKLPKEAFEPQP